MFIDLHMDLAAEGDVEPDLRELTGDDLPPLAIFKANLSAQVNTLRDLLIDGGFVFEGHLVQSRQTDRENIEALARDAERAVAAGAVAGDYGWHPDYPAPFGFIMADNQVVPLDAAQMVAMRGAGAAFKAGLTFFARALKDQIEAAADHAAAQAAFTGASWPA